MAKIVSDEDIIPVCAKLKLAGKTIVLTGGCFDIIHPGHVVFLTKAKKIGDILVVLLESDQKVRQLKGTGRPVYSQKERAQVLAVMQMVDYIVMLPFMESDRDYDRLIIKIRPNVIAAAGREGEYSHHRRCASSSGAKFQIVTKMIGKYSSSKILNRA